MAADRGSGAADSASAEIGKYLDILAKDPNSRVFAPLAEAYRKAGLLDDAIETALEGLRIHPNYLGGRVALGRALFEKRRYNEAADELRKVVKAAPDNIIAHKVLGQVALAQGNLADAEKAFRTVTFLDPHDREAKKALDEISAGALAAPAAVAASAPVSLPPSIAPESSWLEIPTEASKPVEEIALQSAPAEEAPLPASRAPEIVEPAMSDEIPGAPMSVEFEEPEAVSPPAGDLEEPDEAASSLGTPMPEPEARGPVLEEMADEETVDLQEPASPLEIEFFGREPAVVHVPPPLPAAQEPEAEESVFQIFTREPRGVQPGPGREERASRPVFEEVELDPTVDLPQDLEEGEPPVIESPQETPRISVLDDFALEMERSFAAIAPAAEPAPVEPPAVAPASVEEIGWEEESVWQPPPPDEEDVAAPLLAPEEAATEELAWDGTPVAGTTPEEAFEEVVEESAGETFADLEVAEVEPAAQPEPEPASGLESAPETAPETSAGRGVFDTETLATIYVNQGFYGRAAAIYERLAAGSPEDAGLRRKLDEVRARERAQAAGGGQAGEGAPAGAPAAVAGGPERAETIRRLEALMEAFRKGRA